MTLKPGYATCGGACKHQFKGRQSHCPICHQTFASEAGGDLHREGPYEPKGQRRCRSVEEMLAHGYWVKDNPAGTPVLHGAWSKEGKARRQVWWAK